MGTKPILKIGSTGKDVKELQSNLNNRGYNLAVDGIFGTNTLSAVKGYQASNNLAVDGIVGNNTWGSLIQPTQSTTTATKPQTTPTPTPTTSDGFKPSETYNTYENKKIGLENEVSNWVDPEYSRQDLWDDVINKIMNGEKFSYDLNGDALYQQYKDKYIQQGKMAMQDTMGQAAAMTGGYGNSYAATAGNQAYQAQLQNLNDVIPELYQMAYDKYSQERQDLYNQYAMLSDEKNMEYAQSQDKYNRLVNELGYYSNEADNIYNRENTEYWNNKTFDYQQDRDAVSDSQWQATFDEGVKQASKQDAYAMIQAGIIPSDEVLKAAGLSKDDAQKLADAYKTNSGGTGSGGGGQGSGGGSDFKKATFSRIDDNGNYVFYVDGKERTYSPGVNPYTGSTNKDIKNGAFSNGYQPNNINGQKLSKSGITDVVNGVTQNVWKTPDGKLWIWDGTQNKYLEYEE